MAFSHLCDIVLPLRLLHKKMFLPQYLSFSLDSFKTIVLSRITSALMNLDFNQVVGSHEGEMVGTKFVGSFKGSKPSP